MLLGKDLMLSIWTLREQYVNQWMFGLFLEGSGHHVTIVWVPGRRRMGVCLRTGAKSTSFGVGLLFKVAL